MATDLIKTKYSDNEIAKAGDFQHTADSGKIHLDSLLFVVLGVFSAAKPIIIDGLLVEQRGVPSMNVNISLGMGYDHANDNILYQASELGPIPVTNGHATLDRIDTIEIRSVDTDFDSETRAFKDPNTGTISYSATNTKIRVEIEAQVVVGTPGSGNAPNATSGWVKIAEIEVAALESTSIVTADIKNITATTENEANSTWTAETTSIFQLGSLNDFLNRIDDLESNAMTIAGVKTLSGANIHSAVNKFTSGVDSTTKDNGAVVIENGGMGVEKSVVVGDHITGDGLLLTDPIPYFVGKIGSDYPIVGSTPAIAALTHNRIAHINNGTDDLEMFEYGITWASVGNPYSFGAVIQPTIAALSSTRVAFINGIDDNLTTFDFGGTNWTITGNALNIVSAGTSYLTALSSTRVAFIDTANMDLRTYDFDGTDWAQVGNDLNISGIGEASITTLSSSRIAFIDETNEDLRTYDFDGTDWAQVGNDLNISGISNVALTSLTSNKVVFIDSTIAELRTYDFDGTDWSLIGGILALSGIGDAAITTLSPCNIAFIDSAGQNLRVYSLNFSYMKTPFQLF